MRETQHQLLQRQKRCTNIQEGGTFGKENTARVKIKEIIKRVRN
jgi:hypothetical protein